MARKNRNQTATSRALLLCCHMLLMSVTVDAQGTYDTLGLGWSKTSVNTVIFRRNSITSFKGDLYASYYDTSGGVIVAHKKGTNPWVLTSTGFNGRVADAHNSISMIADGNGEVHLAWDHHNNPLNYARSGKRLPMIGTDEEKVTYPEFYRMPGGDLIFLHRNGESGRGNLIMNRYDIKAKKWRRIQDNLIDGEGERNAYWQAFVSDQGTIHLSWVWRESPDVASNHDLCYARSHDGGVTWEKSNGNRYTLPITTSNAEYAMLIPEGSDLINQTSMTATHDDKPVIATYWNSQYFIVSNDGNRWKHEQVSKRTTSFTLKGGGTKKIPISRPLIISKDKLIFRDNERHHLVTIATRKGNVWTYEDFIPIENSAWEPTGLNNLLFLQDVGQGDGEKLSDRKPTPVVIMTIR